MIYSMTGYGKATVLKNGYSVETEIKSVNSRYLDISLKIPRTFSPFEFDLRDRIKNKIARGKLYVTLSFKKEGVDDTLADIDLNAVKTTVKILNDIKDTAGIKDDIKLENILSFQNFLFSDSENELEEEYKLVVESVDKALDNLEIMRKQEGQALAKDLTERLNAIEQTEIKIENLSPDTIKEYFEKLKDKAVKLTADLVDNQDRLMQELAFLSEKYDVTEECVRLKSHIKMFRETMDQDEPSGRRLNFICQEMNREANTINSKSVSSEISAYGISIKEELEKIREQIQNIE